jgi:hypothetical protein
MAWLEMSRDEAHGGIGWGFGECLWCPTQRDGGGKWGYWELMRSVKAGDTVVHLRGVPPNAFFVGYSVADTDAYETPARPPQPGQWEHSSRFIRVPLRDFSRFATPLNLSSAFNANRDALLDYHRRHSPVRSANGRLLFFVPQAGRLQCQNGAYLSELDEELSQIILSGRGGEIESGRQSETSLVGVTVGEQFREVLARIGQDRFSQLVRDNYGGRCCFPSCDIAEPRLLVGAHIARWVDAPQLRGDVSNGLCLCLFHDKMFESGYFTIAADGRIVVNNSKVEQSAWGRTHLLPHHGVVIHCPGIHPSRDALQQHWARVGIEPPVGPDARGP